MHPDNLQSSLRVCLASTQLGPELHWDPAGTLHPRFLRVSDGGSQLRAPPGVQPCSEFLPGPEGVLRRRSPQPSSMARATVGSICAGDALRTRRAHLPATRHPQALEMGARLEPPAAHHPERRGASPSVSKVAGPWPRGHRGKPTGRRRGCLLRGTAPPPGALGPQPNGRFLAGTAVQQSPPPGSSKTPAACPYFLQKTSTRQGMLDQPSAAEGSTCL